MEKDIKKSAKLTLLVGVLMLIVIATSTTYAYFKTRIKSPGSKISVTGSNFSLNITDNALTASGLKPIYDKNKETQAVKKEFTISIGSDGITSACYDLYIDIESLGSNLRNGYFKYEITNGTDTYAGNFNGKTDGSQILIMRNQNINTTNTSNSYTLYLWLAYGDNDDSQGELLTGDAASRTYKGRILAKAVTGECKETSTIPPVTLSEAVVRDNPKIKERTDFSVTNTENTTGVIYQTNKTEDGSYVYYYSGNTTNNWVKFGKYENDGPIWGYNGSSNSIFKKYSTMEECTSDSSNNICKFAWKSGDDIYWRIIRTNEDGSVRLLYAGNTPSTKYGCIDISNFNENKDDPMYAGYMYGTSGTLESNRTNENDSTIKTIVDTWYENNLLTNYDKYISKTAIYCNDRSIGNGTYSLSYTSKFRFGGDQRLIFNKLPTYKCGGNGTDGLFESTQAIVDKFSVSTESGGNGQLKYPIALMTADEVYFAGGVWQKNLASPYAWYHTNSIGESIAANFWMWWTMSPSEKYDTSSGSSTIYGIGVWAIYSSVYNHGFPSYSTYVEESRGVRPVISLSSCATIKSGNGTPESPYEIDETSCS